MSNPQTENGYTRIANELVDVLCRTNLSPHEGRIVWCVFRKTYGFNKKDDWISLSQLVEMTGMHKAHVSRAKRKLIERRIVTQSGNKLAFNKLYDQWTELPKQVTEKVTQTGNTPPARLGNTPPPVQVITPPPKQADTKDTITKDILQKKPSSTKKGPNPGVQAIMNAMHECFGELDDSEAKNRQYAWNLLLKARKNMPGATDGAVQRACVELVRAAARHDFWMHKITRVEHVYKNAKRITQDLREHERSSKIAIIS